MTGSKISVVITAYNRAHSLSVSVGSVLAQTYRDIEIIVVDDGSTDDTEAVARDIADERVRYVKITENKGASAARNRGIEEAHGEWVMVWDSDDVLDVIAIETLVSAAKAHPEAVIVSAPARMKSGEKILSFPKRIEGFVVLDQILCKYLGNDEKVRMAKRAAYHAAPYAARNIDFIVAARLAVQGPWYHLDRPLGTVTLDNPDSLTRGRKKFDRARSAERAPHLVAFMEEFGKRLKKNCPSRYAQLAYGTARSLISAGDGILARRYARAAFTSAPWNLRYAAAYLSCLSR